MPDILGIEVVEKAIPLHPMTLFVMVSQVEAKTLLENAYAAGIEFFIHKPINRNEILAIAGTEKEIQSIEQRIRRIIKQALGNIAIRGLEDFNNEYLSTMLQNTLNLPKSANAC